MLKREEDGFTLIELVISMGVFSIVAIAIALFMQTGTNSYQNARNELDLQMESQMLINQIRDMAYSANYAEYDAPAATVDPSASPGVTAVPMPRTLTLYQIAVDYTPAPTGSATSTPAPTPDPAASPGATAVPATGSKHITSCEIIVWDPDTKKLYYDKNTIAPGATDATVPTADLSNSDWRTKHLFCSYMENFSVDTDATGKIPNNTINLTLNMRAQKQKYELREGITVRNKWVEYP
ncbi:MAG: type II secretion system GspH family protein [Lachnospiraceae bacterium]|nr:type II secretion system GspH family protein [Lachnospiraceae bacterium]